MTRAILAILGLVLCGNVWSQVDREFWFAAPEVTHTHADEPILLRMAAENLDAEVVVSIPAEPSFDSLVFDIPAGQALSVNLTDYIDLLENRPSNTVLNRGLLIRSSADITAYYEVKGEDFNSDLFALKGANALGTEFYTPFQNTFANHPTVDGWSSFDVVATEDNTTITITPSRAAEGRPAGEPFTITLDRGQTFSVRAAGKQPQDHLVGSHIVSDKPIAVTTKDDSVFRGGWDLIGDQIVPISVLGTEYIVGDGWNFFMATEDNTELYREGFDPIELDAGEQVAILRTNNSPYFVSASAPVYVFNMLLIESGSQGTSGELSGALIPHITCTGSDRISFTRSAFEPFWLIILVKTIGITDFFVNGDPDVISASDFNIVSGTDGEWSWARKYIFEPEVIPVGQGSVVRNTSASFHLGILSGTSTTGAKYGYFSNFGNLDLGVDFEACDHENIILSAGLGRDSYKWSTGETSSSIKIDSTGEYWVRITEGACEAQDTVFATVKPGVFLNLGADTLLCAGDSIQLTGLADSLIHNWSTGETTNAISVGGTDTIMLAVTNGVGCTNRDTIIVETETSIDDPILGDTLLCDGDTLFLNVDSLVYRGGYFFETTWSSGDTVVNVSFTEEGQYWLDLEGTCDERRDTFYLTIDPGPSVAFGPDTFYCQGTEFVLEGPGSMSTYLWSTGDSVPALTVESPGVYRLFVTNNNGCVDGDTIALEEEFPPNFALPAKVTLCAGESLDLKTEENHDAYVWSTGASSSSINVDQSGLYIVEVSNLCGTLTDSSEVTFWEVSVPNVITPNEDGKNDQFVVLGADKGTWELEVVNRWGHQVYKSNRYDNTWPEEAPSDGTYFFHLLEVDSPQCNDYKGWMVITR